MPPVVAGRVLVRHVRRVDGERVAHVRVGRRAVAVQLPVRRDGQPVPAGVVEPALGEVLRRVRARRQAERPVAGELEAGRVGPQPGAGGRPRGRLRGDLLEVTHAARVA